LSKNYFAQRITYVIHPITLVQRVIAAAACMLFWFSSDVIVRFLPFSAAIIEYLRSAFRHAACL